MNNSPLSASQPLACDVLILGGGLAGLGIALQLAKSDPLLQIIVIERREGLAPEAAFKVGESTVEIGGHYLSHTLGLYDYLKQHQLTKMGLRYFLTGREGNDDITQRCEAGWERFAPFETYQLDRGRLENELTRLAQERGIRVVTGIVDDIVPGSGADDHTVSVKTKSETALSFAARWMVDASGRAALLKRKMGLEVKSPHNVNAAWFRVPCRLKVDDWSDDVEWRARVVTTTRWLSTSHLLGKGYWVWIIPLASGSTSIGIVADPRVHPFETMNTFARAQAWLETYEPQLALHLKNDRNPPQDFRVMAHCSHGAKRLFSHNRWGLIGEAGVFLDPLYSPGSDFIGMGNTFLCDLILREQRGENTVQRTEYYNAYMQSMFSYSLVLYEDQYAVLGDSRVMTKKIVWDAIIYWGTFPTMFAQNHMCDLDLLKELRPLIARTFAMDGELQTLFREAAQRDEQIDSPVRTESGFLNLEKLRLKYRELYGGMLGHLTRDELMTRLLANLQIFEETFVEIKDELARGLPTPLVTLSPDEIAAAKTSRATVESTLVAIGVG